MKYQGKNFFDNVDLSVSCEPLENWGSLEKLFPKAKSWDNIYCIGLSLDNAYNENGRSMYVTEDGFEDVFIANPDVILGSDTFYKYAIDNGGKFDNEDCFFSNKKSAMKVANWLKKELKRKGLTVDFSIVNL